MFSRATSACQEDPAGVNYRGDLSQTITNLTCQAWTSQDPHRHTRTPANYPNAGLDENYCRNPDNDYTAWCYTTNPWIRWKFCAVGYLDPRCQGIVVVIIMWENCCSKLINMKIPCIHIKLAYLGRRKATKRMMICCGSWKALVPKE